MTGDIHDQARELIAVGEGLSDAQQSRLGAHLAECEACRRYAEAAKEVVRGLRSVPLAADSRLVRATKMRVRFHAVSLQKERQRMWLVAMSCLGVGLSATLTAPFLWRLFAWLGEQAGVSTAIWQASFLFFYIAPALAVSVLLLARGAYLTDTGEQPRQGQ